MATTNVGKPFGIVTSQNQATAITESKKADNSGQFYITRTNNTNTGGVGNTEGNASEAISLTINGNVLRGISKDDATKLANLSGSGSADIKISSGLVKGEDGTIGVNIGDGLEISENNQLNVSVGDNITTIGGVQLNADYLSGIIKDNNGYYYSKGGIYFANTTKSGQKQDINKVEPLGSDKHYMRLRLGTGLSFQEGYQDIPGVGSSSSQILGHDGKYYINIDNKTIGLNKSSQLQVKTDNTLTQTSSGLAVNLPSTSSVPSLTVLPSTSAILVNDSLGGLCVDIKALTQLVKLIMAAK